MTWSKGSILGVPSTRQDSFVLDLLRQKVITDEKDGLCVSPKSESSYTGLLSFTRLLHGAAKTEKETRYGRSSVEVYVSNTSFSSCSAKVSTDVEGSIQPVPRQTYAVALPPLATMSFVSTPNRSASCPDPSAPSRTRATCGRRWELKARIYRKI